MTGFMKAKFSFRQNVSYVSVQKTNNWNSVRSSTMLQWYLETALVPFFGCFQLLEVLLLLLYLYVNQTRDIVTVYFKYKW